MTVTGALGASTTPPQNTPQRASGEGPRTGQVSTNPQEMPEDKDLERSQAKGSTIEPRTGDPPSQEIARRRDGTSVPRVGTPAARGSGAAAGTDDGMQPPGGCNRHRHHAAQHSEYSHSITDSDSYGIRGKSEEDARDDRARPRGAPTAASNAQVSMWHGGGQERAVTSDAGERTGGMATTAAAPLASRAHLVRLLSTPAGSLGRPPTLPQAAGQPSPEHGNARRTIQGLLHTNYTAEEQRHNAAASESVPLAHRARAFGDTRRRYYGPRDADIADHRSAHGRHGRGGLPLDDGLEGEQGHRNVGGPRSGHLHDRLATDQPRDVRGSTDGRVHLHGPCGSLAGGNGPPLSSSPFAPTAPVLSLALVPVPLSDIAGIECGDGPAGASRSPLRRATALRLRHLGHGALRRHLQEPRAAYGADADLRNIDGPQHHGAHQLADSGGATRSSPPGLAAAGIICDRQARGIRGRGRSPGPTEGGSGARGVGMELGRGEIRGPNIGSGPREYANRRQLLERLAGDTARQRRAADHLDAASVNVGGAPERCKRARLSDPGDARRTPHERVGTCVQSAASHTEPFGIQHAPQAHGRLDAELVRDEGVRCPRIGGAGPCEGGARLEASVGPASIEDDKMHFIFGDVGCDATTSAGAEAEAAGGTVLAAAAASGGGGPNTASVHAAATWARHALVRDGADGGVGHLSAA